MNWSVVTNYSCHTGGRIWCLWNPNTYDVKVGKRTLFISKSSIEVVGVALIVLLFMALPLFTLVTGFLCGWICVVSVRELLALGLCVVTSIMCLTLMRGGDVSEAEIRPFRSCIQLCQLHDPVYNGPFFTWNKKQLGDSRVYSKIDRALINDHWESAFPHFVVHMLPEGYYDHCPCVMEMFVGDIAGSKTQA